MTFFEVTPGCTVPQRGGEHLRITAIMFKLAMIMQNIFHRDSPLCLNDLVAFCTNNAQWHH